MDDVIKWTMHHKNKCGTRKWLKTTAEKIRKFILMILIIMKAYEYLEILRNGNESLHRIM